MIKNLLITVPTHTGMIFHECTTSLIANINILNRAGISVTFKPILLEAYVCRAKNKALKMLEDEEKYDAVMIIDYDLGFDEYAISKLIVAEKDFIGGAYPYKSTFGYPAGYIRDSKRNIEKDERGVLKAQFVPGGFILITRKIIDEMSRLLDIRESSGIKFYFDEGFVSEEDDQWLGEDKVFCKRLQKCGIDMWIEPRIDYVHMGMCGNQGMYIDYLDKIEVKENLSTAIKRITQGGADCG